MIFFCEKETLNPAVPDPEGHGFYVGEDGAVYELIVQGYANYTALAPRDDLDWVKTYTYNIYRPDQK